MSKLAAFRAAELELAKQLAVLESFKNDKAVQKEIQFEGELKQLMLEYGMSLQQVIAILDPGARAIGSER